MSVATFIADIVAPALFLVVLASAFVCGGLFLQLIFVVTANGTVLERFYFQATFAVIVALYAAALADATSIFPRILTRSALTVSLSLLVGAAITVGPLWSVYRLLSDLFGTRTFSQQNSYRAASPCRSVRSLVISAISLTFCSFLYIAAWRGFPVSSVNTSTELILTEILLGKVAYIGVAGMGVLGGYAAFSTPQAFLMPYLSRHGGEQAVTLLQALNKRQRYLLNLWAQKKRQIAQLQVQSLPTESDRPAVSRASAISSWIAGAVARVGGGGQQTVDQLENECNGIEKVSMSIFLQTQDVHQAISVAERGRTLSSRIWAVAGVFLSIFATGRILLIAINVVVVDMFLGGVENNALSSDSGMEGSQLPRVLSLLLNFIGNSTDGGGGGTAALTRAAVFFNALTILISLRGFMLTIFRLTTSYASSVSSKTMIVAFTSCMGAYFIGQVLMLRLQLPSDSHSSLISIIGPLSRSPYQRLNDVCFLASCVLSFVLHRYVLQRDRNVID
ncbi:transmembrane protein, putative [Bodo saltans]|uniref:Transmembrane protein, putative n=1 Tax=Bodo saltans TaxID=75058 RepID=A0A0S4IU79_BODSA|nr:transmembrane protein, putative [Bodo saltans]|eukprot:CUF93516.1 transmembrane protein, putative [Bodo saltans]